MTRKNKRYIGSKSLIVHNEPLSLVTESYKMFRSNLSYMNFDHDRKVLLFTSSQSEEGKTTTVANTALSFAKTGLKTLVIEGDLRRARLHEMFGVEQQPGLTNVLVDKKPISSVLKNIEGEENLHILTAGPLSPAPTELLASSAIHVLFEELRNEYDMIIIDAPPILNVTDAAILSRVVDGVVLVVASKETKREAALAAKRALEKVNAPILGSVMTKVKNNKKRESYYYYRSDTKRKR